MFHSRFARVVLPLLLVVFVLALASAPHLAWAQDASATAVETPQSALDKVIKTVDYLLVGVILCLSIIGMTLIFSGFIRNRESVFMPPATTETIRAMIQNKQFKELMDFTEADPSFISQSLNPALKRAPSFSAMKEAMETAVGEQTAQRFRGIEYLNIIGNLGPLLGLLGTVLGMIEAFQDLMAAGGDANPAKLAGGISTALCHTFLGLFLAVPCLAVFGIQRTMVDRLTTQGALIAEELLLLIKPAEAKPAAVSAAAVRPGATPQPAVRKAPVPVPPSVQG